MMRLGFSIAITTLVAGVLRPGAGSAQTLGELGATTAIQGTLAGNAASGAHGTLDSVRHSLATSSAQGNAAWKTALDPRQGNGGAGRAASGWAAGASAGASHMSGRQGWAMAAAAGASRGSGQGWAKGGDESRHAALRR